MSERSPDESPEDTSGEASWPSVSVIMPVRNEATHLRDAVAAVLAQDYPGPLDLCCAVGPSTDGTEVIAAQLAASAAQVSVVDNPSGLTPSALNRAIAATSGSVIVRVDGHCELPGDYVRTAVDTMRATGAVNVGGRQVPVGTTEFERAVAIASSSWFGTGGARFRVGGIAGPTDTVYLGVFDREAVTAVGGFDETLIRNQDYELNIRLRRAGGVIWFDPRLEVIYRPRGSVRALARQYFEYGFWKYRVARRFPGSLRARQLIPVVVTVAVIAGTAGAAVRRASAILPLGYSAAVAAVSLTSKQRRAQRVPPMALMIAFATMHLAWGFGFLRSALSPWRGDGSRARSTRWGRSAQQR